ncbi:hypothetical protein LBMAG42_23340 [Deltaproteobacteria bacterium]|nr:hypothetical protein LBMAG42_23340 [Deltaproteobacteria bacterium]
MLGLAAAEAGFSWADDGAFPHLNLYVPDEKLAVRLLPGGEERIQYSTNPVSTVHINAEGYRGAAWAPPSADEIVVVGDSQVFGLGVNDDETASAVLARTTGRSVINAGVPTYGPVEYLAVIDELLASRHPATVVLVLNFSNDLFEIDAPNTGRHAVWDGWAVRKETAPASVTNFPGRSWLYSRSHLFYAARRAWAPVPEGWGLGVASEGTWKSVVSAAVERSPAEDPRVADAALANEAGSAAKARAEVEFHLTELYFSAFPELRRADEGLALEAHEKRAQAGDIVYEHFGGEGAREVPVTAELLRKGAAVRGELEGRLREWAKAHPDDRRATAIGEALAAKDASQGSLDALATRVAEEVGGRSPFEPFVRVTKAHVEAAGAELVVVALPLDVQVSDTEWAKYGAEKVDMTESRALLTDLVAGASRMGLRALDLTEALAAAEPGAFQDGDLHMTAKGQAAAGEAIAAALKTQAPRALPGPGLPPGRSRVPSAPELAAAPEITVKGSSAAHCSTRQVREWLYVECTTSWGELQVDEEALAQLGYGALSYDGERSEPSGVAVRTGEEVLIGLADAMYGADAVRILTPLVPGRPVEVDVWWTNGAQRLSVAWEGEKAAMSFTKLPNPGRPTIPTICKAKSEIPFIGDASRGCATTYPDDCVALRDCASGTRGHLPTCAVGEANAGSAGHCHALCDPAHPCVSGVCTDWQGGGVCL